MTRSIIFGSIGTLAETSHLQREAFNQAFGEAGLDWHWDESTYFKLLQTSGGKQRIEAYAQSTGTQVDAERIHARKSALFQGRLSSAALPLRPGVEDTLTEAQRQGVHVALATCTSRNNVDGILGATGIEASMFACIVDRSMINEAKPAPDAFLKALSLLDTPPDAVVAIEDNPDGAKSALAARLPCVVTPGAAHKNNLFPEGAIHPSSLTLQAALEGLTQQS